MIYESGMKYERQTSGILNVRKVGMENVRKQHRRATAPESHSTGEPQHRRVTARHRIDSTGESRHGTGSTAPEQPWSARKKIHKKK